MVTVRFFADSSRIQALVSKRNSKRLESACQLFIPANGVVDNLRGHIAHAQGVIDSITLLRKLAHAQKNGAPGVGIYVATRPVLGGKDAFYFIGTIKGVCERLSKIPEDAT